MKPGVKKRRRRKLIRRLLSAFVAGLLFLWGTANLFFSISWGTNLVSARLEKRLGLPCAIESITWTPWGGVTVQDFVVSPGKDSGFSEEILRVDTLMVDPSWFSLVQGKKRFERLEVRGVTGEVSIEFLKSLLKSDSPSLVQESPEADISPEKSGESASPATPANEDQEAPSQSQPQEKGTPEPKMEAVDDFEGVVVFREVNLALISEKYPELSIAVESLEGELPIWGRERDGTVGFSALHVGGKMVNGEEEISVTWRDQYLRIDNHAVKMAGLDLNVNFAIRMVEGMPFGFQIEAPEQQIDLSSLYGQKTSPISVRQFALKSRFQGYLSFPQSYAGIGSVGFQDLSLRDGRDQSVIEFHRGYGEVRINRAGLLVPVGRMIGDEEAVLLNGFVTSNGEAAATVRVVGSPERAEVYEKRVRRASDQWTLDFEPLVTEDRLYRDLRLESTEDGVTVDLGEGRKPVPFIPALNAILTGQHPSSKLLQ